MSRKYGCRVWCPTLDKWFNSIRAASRFAGANDWTMSKKMEVSGSFIDANGNKYIREYPMKTKNDYVDTGNTIKSVRTFKGRRKRKTANTEPTFTFQELPAPVQDLINSEISRMLVSNVPWEEIKAFMLKMGCKKIVLSLDNL